MSEELKGNYETMLSGYLEMTAERNKYRALAVEFWKYIKSEPAWMDDDGGEQHKLVAKGYAAGLEV